MQANNKNECHILTRRGRKSIFLAQLTAQFSRNNTFTTRLSVIFLYLHVTYVLKSLLTLRITFLCCGSTVLSKLTLSIILSKCTNIKTNSKQDMPCNFVTLLHMMSPRNHC